MKKHASIKRHVKYQDTLIEQSPEPCMLTLIFLVRKSCVSFSSELSCYSLTSISISLVVQHPIFPEVLNYIIIELEVSA